LADPEGLVGELGRSGVCGGVLPPHYPTDFMDILFFQGRTWSHCVDQFSIPDASNLRFVPNRLNVSLHFTSSSWVTVADGTGRLYLLHSGDRKSDDKWKVSVFHICISLLFVDHTVLYQHDMAIKGC